VLDIAIHQLAARNRARLRRRRGNRAGKDHVLHFLDPGFAAQREGFLADHLAAVVLTGIVRRRHHGAAIEAVGSHGEVHLVGAAQAVIHHVAALLDGAVDEGLGQRRRGQPHVARDRVAAGPEIRDKRAPQLVEQALRDFGRVETANVVGLEYGSVNHVRCS
jgi:hypothetical protein